jgi:Zn-dependent M28 family amino/carboxypeptidase
MPEPSSASPRTPLAVALAALALLLGEACGTPAVPAAPPEAGPVLPEALAPGSAWSHLEALAAIGPRATGSAGAERARSYIAGQLASLGIRVEDDLPLPAAAASGAPASQPGDAGAEGQPQPAGAGPEPRNVVGVVPGASEDLILLVAPYDAAPSDVPGSIGANDGASGAAVLLALAGVLERAPLPYTTWLLFLDGEAPGADGAGALRGSRAAARRLALSGQAPRVRLLVALNRVCDRDLRVARDLLSNRAYREEFWRAAQRLGYRELFEQDRFEQPPASHWPFLEVGVRSVALVDSSFAAEPPGGPTAQAPAAAEADDLAHCSPQSLASVSAVTLDALEAITRRLAKIDRFSAAPDLALTRPAPGEAAPSEAASDPWQTPGEAKPAEEPASAPAPATPPAGSGEQASPPAAGS